MITQTQVFGGLDDLDIPLNRAEGARRGARITGDGKARVQMYLDNDVIEHFRRVATEKGRGLQAEINQHLRATLILLPEAGQGGG